MPQPPVPEQVAKWRRWIHEDIRHDVVGMFFRRQMWRDLNAILAANPEVGETPSSYWQFHHGNYAASQAIAIRRQAADLRRDTSSLRHLLEELAQKPDLLTQDGYVALLDEHQAADPLMVDYAKRDWRRWADPAGIRFDGAIARVDAQELEGAGEQVKLWVDEHVAHDAAEPTVADAPTFAEIHETIDKIGGTFQKYAAILTGSSWALDHMIQDNWRAVFRRPWIP